MPEDEIWIECDLNTNEIPLVILHEYTERLLMLRHGLDYDKAHELASKVEFAHRPNFSQEDAEKLTPAILEMIPEVAGKDHSPKNKAFSRTRNPIDPRVSHFTGTMTDAAGRKQCYSLGEHVACSAKPDAPVVPDHLMEPDKTADLEGKEADDAEKRAGVGTENQARVWSVFSASQVKPADKEFDEEWFGESKVVDDSGKPQKTYRDKEQEVPNSFTTEQKGEHAFYLMIANPFDFEAYYDESKGQEIVKVAHQLFGDFDTTYFVSSVNKELNEDKMATGRTVWSALKEKIGETKASRVLEKMEYDGLVYFPVGPQTAMQKSLVVETKTLKPHSYGCLMAILPEENRKEISDWILENVPEFHQGPGGVEFRSHITVAVF